MANKLLSFFLSAAVLTAAMSNTSVSADTYDGSSDGAAIKIMPIGDSITDGYGISGSYRKFLYHKLIEKGYSIDMVGSKGGGWTPSYTDEDTGESFEYDDDNTGYSGYAIKEYPGRSGILETLRATDCLALTSPDIVILQIGTNDVIDNHDIDSSGERLTELIDYIFDNIPSDSAVFVTTIPALEPNRSDVYSWFDNYRHSPDWQTMYTDSEAEKSVRETVDKYNSIVLSTVEQLSGRYEKLYSGDINSVITDTTAQLADGVHPNNTGYKLMGEYWAGKLEEYLGGGHTPLPDSTTTTTTTVTTISQTTTSDPDIPANSYNVSDLVRLGNHLLGRAFANGEPIPKMTYEEAQKLDMNSDGILDIFDHVMLRKKLLN